MKTRLLIGILAIAMLLCQGLAFAESADDITATAEEMAFTENPSGGMEEAVMTDELTAPSVDPANNDAEDVKM